MNRLMATLLPALLLGCSPSPSGGSPGVVSGEPSGGRSGDAAVRQRWESRTALPHCGEVTLRPGERPRVESQVACLRTALQSGSGGELRLTFFTIEGDPIVQYVRVAPGGEVEVFEDATQDAFGDGRWHHRTCWAEVVNRVAAGQPATC